MALGKKMLLLAAFCGLAWGQTGLTTIQDTLFKADGTKFNGTLTIQWVTFDVNNAGTVVQQSTSVAVVNGNLQVQLAPNSTAPSPANVYTVTYQSDGRNQFTETWTVPVNPVPLKVALVRIGTQAISGTGGGTGTTGQTGGQGPIAESGVTGLQADLAQRPLKGVGFGTNAVAVINDSGQIETAAGTVGNCVFVDGTSGPCTQPTFADAETPGGTVDGTNNTLTLVNTPLGSSLMLFRNGLYMTPGFDYTLTGSSMVFSAGAVPQPGDTLTASYRVDTSSQGFIVAQTAPGGTIHTVPGQVICSLAGASTSATVLTSLGRCDLPPAALFSGDRIEVRFSFAHSGATSGFNLHLNWGNTTILTRSASAQDAAVVGNFDAALTAGGAQLSLVSWGTLLPLLPGTMNAPQQSGLSVDFLADLAQTAPDTVTLTNFTVLRYPGN